MSLTAVQLGWASLGLSAVGAVSSAMGQYQQGKAQAASAQYQAAVARNNQILAQRKADDARKRGELESHQQDIRTRLLQDKITAAGAGHGVLYTGALLKEVESAGALGKLDALTIQSNAEREALGFESQGMNFEAEARLGDFTAGSIKSNLPFQVGATLLSGFSTVADKWSKFGAGSSYPAYVSQSPLGGASYT